MEIASAAICCSKTSKLVGLGAIPYSSLMLQHVIRLTVIFSGLVLATACGTDATTATARLTIQTPCAADADCPASFQCEIET